VDFLIYSRAQDVVRDARWLDRWRAAGVVHVGLCRDPSADRLSGDEAATAVASGRQAVRLLRDAGITSEATFWMGFPDETAARIAETEERAHDWDPDVVRFRLIAPLPYTPAWRPLAAHVVTRDYRRFNQREPVVKPVEMTLDEVREAAWGAERRFRADRMAAATAERRGAGPWTVHAAPRAAAEAAGGEPGASGEAPGAPKKPGPEA
jgi:anaerobic magnesium-protoporphyrin IX monomethyl ester cyclase